MINNPQEALTNLKTLADNFGAEISTVANVLLDNPDFAIWSGSSKPHQHHYGKGGLIIHTNEVVTLTNLIVEQYEYQINKVELFFACLFHDAGKLYDYETYVSAETYKYEWRSIEHKRNIHHISRSGIIWHDAVQKIELLNELYHDKVLHAILAHHGQREFGSPVAPKSRVAWLLHLADGISARLYDADTLDVVNR